MEALVADYLATHVSRFIKRATKHGSKDRGDLVNVETQDCARVVVEVKDVAAMSLGAWLAEAEVERVNDGALVGLVVHKRRGVSSPGDQFVAMTLRDLAALLSGVRPADQEQRKAS
jgi:hypothetical protein